MSTYRSGLKFRPPLGLGGHGFTTVDPPEGFADDPEAFPETPMLLRCLDCHVLVWEWELREGFMPRPCMGRVAALPPATDGRLFR